MRGKRAAGVKIDQRFKIRMKGWIGVGLGLALLLSACKLPAPAPGASKDPFQSTVEVPAPVEPQAARTGAEKKPAPAAAERETAAAADSTASEMKVRVPPAAAVSSQPAAAQEVSEPPLAAPAVAESAQPVLALPVLQRSEVETVLAPAEPPEISAAAAAPLADTAAPAVQVSGTPVVEAGSAGEAAAPAGSENTAVEAEVMALLSESEEAILPEPTPEATATPAPTPTPLQPVLGVKGSMLITFGSRTVPPDELSANPSKAVDTYTVALTVQDTMKIDGLIRRKARVVSKILAREKQPLELSYGLVLAPVSGAGSGAPQFSARFRGNLAVDRKGQYSFVSSSQGEPPLQIAVAKSGSVPAASNSFGGVIYGKGEDSGGGLKAKLSEYTRLLGRKRVTVQAQHVDPLRFENLMLAGGPLPEYAGAAVNGNLDYDYDTGNWLTSGINFAGTAGGQAFKDVITGSIKWVEDPHRSSNRKGGYEVNLRFNEARYAGTADEGAFFAGLPDEEAFFAVDSRIPTLSGTISYRDSFAPWSDSDDPIVVSSEVRYDLKSQGVSKRQLVNFIKLWLLIVGPMNDE